MGEKTNIGWTSSTCNPVLARLIEPLALPGREILPAGKVGFHCVKVSAECAMCYAETFNQRGLPERGTGLAYTAKAGEKVEIYLHRPVLEQVLRWQRPRRIFWCSMTDLFGEFVSSEIIQECLDVADAAGEARGHISQLLTKRPERMLNEIGAWTERHGKPLPAHIWPGFSAGNRELFFQRWLFIRELSRELLTDGPLWCSYEPAIGPLVDTARGWPEKEVWQRLADDGLAWIVVGGESGAKARPFDLQWVRDVLDFLRPTGCRTFFKQAGRRPVDAAYFRWMHHSGENGEQRLYANRGAGKQAASVYKTGIWRRLEASGYGGEAGQAETVEEAKRQALEAVMRAGHFPLRLKDRKGADPAEWPAELRVQEWPEP